MKTKLITLEQLCREFDIKGATARQRLRYAKIKKQSGLGWCWIAGSKELNQVRALLSQPKYIGARRYAELG
jgi:hypothetical protein